jgi:uncharacterized protein YdaU (DUF1376 family)
MKRHWMPLYIGDYLKDTRRLSTLEHGAYLLLIMEYWNSGELPNDSRQLARIAGLSFDEWMDIESIIKRYFNDDWTHDRVEHELSEAQANSDRRTAAAKAAVAAREAKKHKNRPIDHPIDDRVDHPIDDPLDIQSPSPSPIISSSLRSEGAEAPISDQKADLYRRGKAILGVKSGGVITDLIKAKGSVAKARAALEQASESGDAKEYIGAIIRNRNHKSEQELRDTNQIW